MRGKPDSKQHLQILDCTLRDGSYAIDFQFTAQDTVKICEALDSSGIPLIEVGHGMGLGASERTPFVAAASDGEYLKAASSVIKKAKWGMFCIPGIATLDDVKYAAGFGMSLLRVGTNVEDCGRAEPFIKLGKQMGMFVCANFMKSYTCTPSVFAEYAANAEAFGADVIYIVDSAGGMLPEQVAAYIEALINQKITIKIGYHGHHNLGLGLSNAIKATQLGVDIIDASLQGLGRSAGNTATEQLICLLLRYGIDVGIDPIKIMDISESLILPFISVKGLNSIDIISGFSLFHSSYMPIIEKISKSRHVDPRHLIIALCHKNKVEAPPELVDAIAVALHEEGKLGGWKHFYQHYYGSEQAL